MAVKEIRGDLLQYYIYLEDNQKTRKLFDLLDDLAFNQVIIFLKSAKRCVALGKLLAENAFPALVITRSMNKDARLEVAQQFRNYEKNILVASSLWDEGMDIAGIDLIINYDMAASADDYHDRVVRAGRFGQKGLVINFLMEDKDLEVAATVQDAFDVIMADLPDQIEASSYIEDS